MSIPSAQIQRFAANISRGVKYIFKTNIRTDSLEFYDGSVMVMSISEDEDEALEVVLVPHWANKVTMTDPSVTEVLVWLRLNTVLLAV